MDRYTRMERAARLDSIDGKILADIKRNVMSSPAEVRARLRRKVAKVDRDPEGVINVRLDELEERGFIRGHGRGQIAYDEGDLTFSIRKAGSWALKELRS